MNELTVTNNDGDKVKVNTFIYLNTFGPNREPSAQDIVWVEEITEYSMVKVKNITETDDTTYETYSIANYKVLPDDHILNTTPYEWLRPLMMNKDYIEIQNVTSLGDL